MTEMIDLTTFCCARGFELYQRVLQAKITRVKSTEELKEKPPTGNLGSAEGYRAVVSKPGDLTASPFPFPEVL